MKIGRALNKSNECINIASNDGLNFFYYNPTSGEIGKEADIARVLAPVSPSKIVCVGLNYRDHAKELGLQLPEEPLIFIKPSSTVIGHSEKIIYPASSNRVDYEAELAVVISKRCSKTNPEKAHEYILGYTCLNDVTARDLQIKDGQWTRAKSFDTFCPVGPFVETDVDDPDNLPISLSLNGEIRQSSTTTNLIFSVFYLIAYISNIMTLESGDVIATGTPAGIGPMKRGDTVRVDIEGIGVLENYVS